MSKRETISKMLRFMSRWYKMESKRRNLKSRRDSKSSWMNRRDIRIESRRRGLKRVKRLMSHPWGLQIARSFLNLRNRPRN